MPNTSFEGAIHVAQRIQHTMAALQIPHSTSQVSEFVTLSMSTASTTPNSNQDLNQDGLEALLTTADKALYAAKENGRNQYCY